MSRGAKIAIGCAAAVLLLTVLGVWGVWSAMGGRAGWHVFLAEMTTSDERAIEHYRRATELRPEDARMQMRLANALSDTGRDDEAMAAWERAAELAPEDAEPLVAIARVRIDDKEYEAAADAAEQAVERDRRSVDAHLALGEARAGLGDYQGAVQALKQADDLGATAREIGWPLGQACEALGERKAAIRAYRRGAGSCDARCKERLAELGEQAPEREERRAERESSSTMGPGEGLIFGGFMLAWFGMYAVILVLTFAGWAAGILALWDCAHRAFDRPSTRALWCIFIFAMHWLGALVYYFAVYRTGDPPRLPPRVRLPQQPPPAARG